MSDSKQPAIGAAKTSEKSVAAIAKELRRQFAETGAYGAADLARVLGDPTRAVQLSSTPPAGENKLGK